MGGKAYVLPFVFLLCLGTTADQFAARSATVIVQGEIRTTKGRWVSIGAGVIVGQNGGLEILTAYHVANHDHLQVFTEDGETLGVVSVEHLVPRDLAIVKTSVAARAYPKIRAAGVGPAGTAMYTYGAPNDQRWLLSTGAIRERAVVPAQLANGEFAMTCPTCDNGSSGGGIFNSQGELEGILISVYTAPDGVYTYIAEPVLNTSGDLANR